MDFKEKIESEIAKQRTKVSRLRQELKAAEIYLQAQMDILGLIPNEDGIAIPEDANLRVGSDPAKVREILIAHGKPMHVMDILAKLGKDTNPGNRATLSGTLGRYASKNKVFAKTAPNTFGLLSPSSSNSEQPAELDDDVPVTFGSAQADQKKALDEDVPF